MVDLTRVVGLIEKKPGIIKVGPRAILDDDNLEIFTVEDGKIVPANSKFEIRHELNTFRLMFDHGAAHIMKVSLGKDIIAKELDYINKIYQTPNYRSIKTDEDWLKMYGCRSEYVSFIDRNNHPCPRKLSCIPCHYCGIIMPLTHITVDHKAPSLENKSERRGYAVLKMLRALNNAYTKAPGEGIKSKMAQSTLAGNAPSVPVIPTKMDRAAPSSSGSRTERDTITEKGILFFNIAILYFRNGIKMYNYDHFVHTLLNLAPVCSRCNSSKQENRGTFIPKAYDIVR